MNYQDTLRAECWYFTALSVDKPTTDARDCWWPFRLTWAMKRALIEPLPITWKGDHWEEVRWEAFA